MLICASQSLFHTPSPGLLAIAQEALKDARAQPPTTAAPVTDLHPSLLNCPNSYAKSTNNTLPPALNVPAPPSSIPRPRGSIGTSAGFNLYEVLLLDPDDEDHHIFLSNLRVRFFPSHLPAYAYSYLFI